MANKKLTVNFIQAFFIIKGSNLNENKNTINGVKVNKSHYNFSTLQNDFSPFYFPITSCQCDANLSLLLPMLFPQYKTTEHVSFICIIASEFAFFCLSWKGATLQMYRCKLKGLVLEMRFLFFWHAFCLFRHLCSVDPLAKLNLNFFLLQLSIHHIFFIFICNISTQITWWKIIGMV